MISWYYWGSSYFAEIIKKVEYLQENLAYISYLKRERVKFKIYSFIINVTIRNRLAIR